MDIFGIDFTSSPSRRKPITSVFCRLTGNVLSQESVQNWSAFDEFEAALERPGPWICGIDFPFGQSRRFVENIGWRQDWSWYVAHVQGLGRNGFRDALNDYKRDRLAGDKEHRRATDHRAGSISPQKLHGIPVGLMFFEGATRLNRSDVTIPLLKRGDPNKIVVEAYPGILARSLINRRSYKNDTKSKQTADRMAARLDLMEQILGGALESTYGLRVEADSALAADPTGDQLDALFCAIQAAWAWTQRDDWFGAPLKVDPLEGWICDPHCRCETSEARQV